MRIILLLLTFLFYCEGNTLFSQVQSESTMIVRMPIDSIALLDGFSVKSTDTIFVRVKQRLLDRHEVSVNNNQFDLKCIDTAVLNERFVYTYSLIPMVDNPDLKYISLNIKLSDSRDTINFNASVPFGYNLIRISYPDSIDLWKEVTLWIQLCNKFPYEIQRKIDTRDSIQLDEELMPRDSNGLRHGLCSFDTIYNGGRKNLLQVINSVDINYLHGVKNGSFVGYGGEVNSDHRLLLVFGSYRNDMPSETWTFFRRYLGTRFGSKTYRYCDVLYDSIVVPVRYEEENDPIIYKFSGTLIFYDVNGEIIEQGHFITDNLLLHERTYYRVGEWFSYTGGVQKVDYGLSPQKHYIEREFK